MMERKTANQNDKISVIVPVYKVEALLGRCVDSIAAQTYADWELILVDDGSPDNCGALCDAAAEKDAGCATTRISPALPRPATPGSRRLPAAGWRSWTATTGGPRPFWRKC